MEGSQELYVFLFGSGFNLQRIVIHRVKVYGRLPEKYKHKNKTGILGSSLDRSLGIHRPLALNLGDSHQVR
jgi:hypothetical protein